MKKNVYLWGAGYYAELTYSIIDKKHCEVRGIVDNSKIKQGNSWKEGIIVQDPSILSEVDYDYVILTPQSYEQIAIQCRNIGIPESKIVSFWHDPERNDLFRDSREVITELEKEVTRYRNRLNNAPYELGMGNLPQIKSDVQLLERMIDERCSMVRYGDGEFEIMLGRERPWTWFQNVDEKLAERLRAIINSHQDNIIIAIADNFGNLEKYKEDAADAIRAYMCKSREDINQFIDMGRCYYNAYVSRPYIMYRDREHAGKIFDLFKKIWEDRRVLIIEGKAARIGVGNDLMQNAASIHRIECPDKNSWDKYEDILRYVRENVDHDTLICVSLGPAATVIAYDLAIDGYQALDIGQLDNEYEWYINGADTRIQIAGKMTAEVNMNGCGNDSMAAHIDLTEYRKQIITEIE